MTPRPNENKWQLPYAMHGRGEVGLADGNVDLNRAGSLEQTNEIAFTVVAKDYQGEPKLDLDPNQRWRSSSLVYYEGGKWMRGRELDRVTVPSTNRPIYASNNPNSLPDFGPRSYTLTYRMRGSTTSMTICLSPVLWRPFENPPIRVFGAKASPVIQRPDLFFDWAPLPAFDRPSHTQVSATTDDPDLGPPMMQGMTIAPSYLDFLVRMPQGAVGERIRRYTSDLLARLVREGKLSAAALGELNPVTGLPALRHHEAIARALEQYLSGSGEYRYTTHLERADRSVDPVEDFFTTRDPGIVSASRRH